MTDRLERLGDPPPDWLTGEALEKARARRAADSGTVLISSRSLLQAHYEGPSFAETQEAAERSSPLALPGVRFTEKQKQMIRDMPLIDEEGQVAELLGRVICVHDELLGCTCYSDPCRCAKLEGGLG